MLCLYYHLELHKTHEAKKERAPLELRVKTVCLMNK